MAVENTGQGIEPELMARIDADRRGGSPFAYDMQKYRDYTFGKQPITITDDQKKVLAGLLKNGFCDNICRRIVSTVASRVRLERLEIPKGPTLEYVEGIYTKNWVRMLARRVHFTAIRDGETYVSLGWDNIKKRVTLTRELAWNGRRGVYQHFNDRGEVEYTVKEWEGYYKLAGDSAPVRYKRRVVWYDNQIGRFVFKGTGWAWFTLPQEKDPATGAVIRDEEQPSWQPWTVNKLVDGEPLGTPCVKFARMDQPTDLSTEEMGTTDNCGTPILAGGVLGIQDCINDDHWNILAANRFTAFQQMWATGVKLTNSLGEKVQLKFIPGTVIHVEDKEAKFGTLSAGDMSQLIATLEEHRKTAANNTNTPAHVITGGDWPSGTALIEADKPLVDQARSLCDSFGPSWASVFNRAIKIAKAFGDEETANLDETTLIGAVFAEPESQDFASRVALVVALAPYVSNRECLRLLNRYTTEQIDTIMQEKKDEQGFFGIPGANEFGGDNNSNANA